MTDRRGFFAAVAALAVAPVLRQPKTPAPALPPEAFKSSGWTPLPTWTRVGPGSYTGTLDKPLPMRVNGGHLEVTMVSHQTGTITVEART